ncbi:MAG TPA: cytochrome c [Polyangiales bacterium]|nr:cytochrome c [Polyangiales bacterium]
MTKKMKLKLKGAGIALGGIVVSALLLFTVAAVKASSRLARKYETHRIGLALPQPSDAAAVARGKHLVEARYGCNVCHGRDLAGGVMIDDPAIGSIRGPNLTSGKGGRTARYSMADWDRIVRHGVKPDGSAAIMPSEDFFKMSDEELSDIVAYTRAIPAVDVEVPPPQLGPIGKVLLAVGKLPISAEHQPDPMGSHPSRPPETADNVEFGEHLAAVCVTCHRANLAGGSMAFGPPAWPAAANLTQHATGLRDWNYSDFERALVQGISKDGRRLREPMTSVVQSAGAMSPTERKALWTYLRSVAPNATGD